MPVEFASPTLIGFTQSLIGQRDPKRDSRRLRRASQLRPEVSVFGNWTRTRRLVRGLPLPFPQIWAPPRATRQSRKLKLRTISFRPPSGPDANNPSQRSHALVEQISPDARTWHPGGGLARTSWGRTRCRGGGFRESFGGVFWCRHGGTKRRARGTPRESCRVRLAGRGWCYSS